MPKKSVQESRDLVADARARINAEKEAARELAAAEAVVAQAEAEEAAAARKSFLDGLLADYQQALADFAVQAALAYAPSKREVDEARDRIEAAYQLVNQNIRPQGFLANPAEENYD